MSRIFGAARQNGYVVRDIEAAMHHWSSQLGIGPWFYLPDLTPRDFLYRGQPSPAIISIALANAGELQIELIQPINDAPSAYRDFLAAGREGLQHMSSWEENLEEIIQRAAAQGIAVYHEGWIGGARFVYFDTETHPGTVYEVCTPDERTWELFRKVREAAQGWDGSDPIRPGR